MQFSSFRIRVDEEMDYNVNYKKPLRDNILIQTPQEKLFYNVCRQF